jgi:hypothetical protein
MCDFVSGIIREKDEAILFYDMVSHCKTASHFKLSGEEYREFEWTKDDPDSLVVRVPEGHTKNENWYRSIILAQYKTRDDLIRAGLKAYHNENTIRNKKKALEAVKQDGYALRFVKDQSESVCLEAVKRNGDALRFVKDQSESTGEDE